jgi:hypothetical protein
VGGLLRPEQEQEEREVRDPNRIPRILKKIRKAWKKNPDMRLIQLLQFLAQDPDKRLDPLYIEDRHLEEMLDKKVSTTKLTITCGRLFEMFGRMSDGETRVAVDAFMRDLKTTTMNELLGDPAVNKMGVKDWYFAKLPNHRIVFRPVNKNTVELLDILNEKTIQFFNAQQKKQGLKAQA